MKKILTLSFILFTGFSLVNANPRNFPSYGNNNSTNGNNHQSSSSKNNSNYNRNQIKHPKPKPVVVNKPRPVVVHQPKPVIVTRPVYNPRPLLQINVNRPRPVYVNNTSSYQGFNFKDFMYTLDNQKFDSDKLSIARQALNATLFDTYQIREIMSVMNFEKTRVEFAKDAYANCLDKQNYFRVNDAFEFSSSIRDLENYIFTSR